MMSSTHKNLTASHDISQEILSAVEALKQGSGFGSIEIIVHEGRVTQIERREKLRFQSLDKKTNPTEKNSGSSL